ncbi:MAG: hypothetical protein ACRD3O_17355, partial [Terriglobia bacterium]
RQRHRRRHNQQNCYHDEFFHVSPPAGIVSDGVTPHQPNPGRPEGVDGFRCPAPPGPGSS